MVSLLLVTGLLDLGINEPSKDFEILHAVGVAKFFFDVSAQMVKSLLLRGGTHHVSINESLMITSQQSETL